MAELSIYKSGHIEITNIPSKRSFTFDHLQELINRGQVTTRLEIGETVSIVGLGAFVIKSGEGVGINFKYDEFQDTLNELNGNENSIAKCARVFEEYKKLENKTVSVEEFGDKAKALQIIEEAIKLYKDTFK